MSEAEKAKMASTIIKWHNKGLLMGPYPTNHSISNKCRINPVFGVDKPDGSVRPVVNYSKTLGEHSLNELLEPKLCTVEYIQRKEIVYTIKQMGIGALMWALDLEDGYFNLKVNEAVTKSMAFSFMGLIFVPMMLLFGLSSAPKLFTDFMWFVVTAIRFACKSTAWTNINSNVFQQRFFRKCATMKYQFGAVSIPLIMYYLDDIFGVQRPSLAWLQYETTKAVLKFLGLSAKESKSRPPSTKQIILGLQYDSILQQVSIPIDKVQKYTALARYILDQKTVTKRLLFSLSGKVRYSALQCRPLAAFARGLEIHGHKRNMGWNSHIHISRRIKKDILFIIEALHYLRDNGISFDDILAPDNRHDYTAFTDASGKEGIGGFIEIDNAPHFQVHWNEITDYNKNDIMWEEMVAIAVLIEENIDLLKNKKLHLWSDNEPAVWMLIKWKATLHRPDLHKLIRKIAKLCIFNNITPWWDHIEGKRNITADRLSRFHPKPFQFTSVRPALKPLAARKTLQKFVDLCA